MQLPPAATAGRHPCHHLQDHQFLLIALILLNLIILTTTTAATATATPFNTMAEQGVAIPNPAEGGPYGGRPADKFETVFDYLQHHGKQNGYGVKRANAGNYRRGKPTRYRINCNRDAAEASTAEGSRLK